jgi:hypothetical protein
MSWDPASVGMPPMPTITPGEDAMSMTIAAVLPTLSAPLAANVTALQAKEATFSGKVTSAQSAYDNADDQGGQSVGQLASMLGQVGQVAQQAGGGAGGGSSIFGSLMDHAMKAAQSGSNDGDATQGADFQSDHPQAVESAPAQPVTGGQGAGGQATGGQGAPPGAPQPQPQSRDGEDTRQEPASQHDDRDVRDRRPPVESAGPGDSGRHSAGPAPVTPTEHRRHGGDDDLARKM